MRATVQRTTRDFWPYFRLARTYNRVGDGDLALRVIADARAAADQTDRYFGRGLDNALLEQEMIASAVVGDDERAVSILDYLDHDENLRPEILVTAAYVRAHLSNDPVEKFAIFEKTIEKLDKKVSGKVHIRSKIALFRGKLFTEIGSLREAERALEDAASTDSENLHIKTSLLRVLWDIVERSASHPAIAGGAAQRARGVCKDILKRDPTHTFARRVQEEVFERFGIG